MGAWLQKEDTRRWARAVLHPAVAHGPGMDSQVCAGLILQDFPRSKYIASLDYHKCFDLLRVAPTVQLLQRAGFCPRFSKLCAHMWGGHVRWSSWNNHVSEVSLSSRGMAIPQGDPAGPLIAAMKLSCGARHVDRHTPAMRESVAFLWMTVPLRARRLRHCMLAARFSRIGHEMSG